MSLKIGIIFYGRFPWNRGIGQLYNLLKELGHNPVIASSRSEKRFFTKNDCSYKVLYLTKNDTKLAKMKSFHFPFNPFWKTWILKLAKEQELDALIVRETPLSWPTLSAAKKLDIPVILDMRENLGATYKANKEKNLLKKIFCQKRLVQLYESFFMQRFDHILTVSDELGSWVRRQYKIPVRKISTLGNFPDADFLEQAQNALSRSDKKNNNFIRLVHAGYVEESRGLQDIIKAIPLILKKKYDVVLRIIGKGNYLPNLKGLAKDLGLERRIEFVPMLPPSQLAEALVDCDIGVCSYLINEQTNQTLPGKLFEYMSVGLPILSSERKPVVRIIEKERCGVLYYSRECKEIATKIISMIKHSSEMIEMGKRGHIAILREYNWKTNLCVLEHVLNRVCQ